MNGEVSIRLRRNHCIIFVLAISFILFLFAISNNGKKIPNCKPRDMTELFTDNNRLPIIYAITPTYSRPEQKAELTRISHVMLLVPNIHWIIVEDASETTTLVKKFLNKTGLFKRVTLLNAKTPTDFKLKGKDPNWLKPRGVEQRNVALDWLRDHWRHQDKYQHSLVFFMDDDNVYSIELFKEMAKIEPGRVGVWPVGLVGALYVEKPILNDNYQVSGFNSLWRPERPFPVDMAGFAISGNLLIENPQAKFTYEVQRGYQESEILRHVTVLQDLQPLAMQTILVWHTRTEKTKLDGEVKLKKLGQQPSNYGFEE